MVQEVVSSGMQIEAEEVGEVAVIAQSVGLQAAFEFLVAVLAFAAVRVGIVGGARQDDSTGPVGDYGTAVRALGMGLAFDDHPPLLCPGLGPIPIRHEEPLRPA